MKKAIRNISNIALSLILGGAILFWMYRDFDFLAVKHVMLEEMDWWWMILSMPFGIAAQAFRGWRWRLSLEPLGERPRYSTSINSIFISYALSLLIPRVGEFSRCLVLKRQDGISFPKALGTVETERVIDSLLLLAITAAVILSQITVFDKFFDRTDTNFSEILKGFSYEGYMVTGVCGIAALLLLYFLMRKMALFDKVKSTAKGMIEGIGSLRGVKNMPLFIALTLGIWVSYFIHYYLTFFCFESTSHLGIMCALVTFIVGSIAVIVPTPNGAGPWHFAVKTMLILYGIADTDALYFVLIVHTMQTLLVVLLGIYAWTSLSLAKRYEHNQES